MNYSYLETRSCRVNTSFIIFCQTQKSTNTIPAKKIYSPDLIVAFICQIEEALSDILSLLTGGIKCETELTFSAVTLVTKATLIKEIYEQRATFYLGFLNPSVCLTVWNT